VKNAVEALPDGASWRSPRQRADRRGVCRPARRRAFRSYVMLSVADTGIGMDEQTRARVFEPFFTTRDAPPRPGWTGDGARSVAQHEGWIAVESAWEGSVFKIYLPASRSGVPTGSQSGTLTASRSSADDSGGGGGGRCPAADGIHPEGPRYQTWKRQRVRRRRWSHQERSSDPHGRGSAGITGWS